MKIVINRSYGGFRLSDQALKRYNELSGGNHARYIGLRDRVDPLLVQVVEELGDEANGRYSFLTVIEIPSDVKYQIEDYDGWEWVAEDHRTWP